MAFPHRFESMRQIRKKENDLQQQAVRLARERYACLVAERDRLAAHRATLLIGLREITTAESIDVVQVLNLQRHAEQVATELRGLDSAIVEAVARMDACLDELLSTNQSLRVLERLIDRQEAEQKSLEDRSMNRDIDEITTALFRRRGD
jgi:flagellar export protein FliJ